MSPNRRIFLNIVATYGRSLYALAIGLFTARWTLHALGSVDYGLYGVIGGLTAFITYFNGILGGAIGRFYAVAIGRSSKFAETGLEECRMWFTTATVIHIVLPVALMIIGYPVGEYAIHNWLTIPPDRILTCVWVWRFVCVTCLIGMVSIPWNAMYIAKQCIAELTVYSFATSTINAGFVYYMVSHPGLWLSKYAFWQCTLGLLPNAIIAVRAFYLFPECRFLPRYARCWQNVKRLWGYASWNAWGALGAMLRTQGAMVLINMVFGPVVNAAAAIGNSISMHCISLSGSMIGAFSPAIYSAWGAGEQNKARDFGFRACKFGALLIIVFAVPLCLEIKEVLRIWLTRTPEYAAGFCVFALMMNLVDKVASGQMMVVNANGKIAMYQAFLGTSQVLTLPIAICLVIAGVGPYAVGWAMVGTMCFNAVGRAWFARRLVGMSYIFWLLHIVVPIVIVTAICAAVGYLPQIFMRPSLVRIFITTAFVEISLLPLGWYVLLSDNERSYVADRLKKVIGKT